MKIYADMAEILGIFEQGAKKAEDGLTETLMEFILNLRAEAKKEKNYALADKIRDGLKELGVIVEDTKSGAKWKRE